jgi:phospho-N-acetylmuramoyl-pentapeptide-transferase
VIALLIAGTVAFLTSIIGTPFLISWLRAHGIGQPIREDGPKGHVTKAGTPTMGGIGIVAGTLLGYAIAHLREQTIFTRGGILVVLAIAGAGLVGGLDDWIKVRNARNLGLNKRAKFGGLLIVAIGFGVLSVSWANVPTTLSFTRHDSIGLELGPVLFVVWAVLLFLGTSNAVNLTDGLDGLAAGSSIFSWAAYAVIAFWAFRHPEVYQVPQALDLALIGAAMVGGLAGFLWWNAPPAQIFMGDTGSLAIGAGLAAMALMTSTHLLLPIIGGIFVIETLSVITQVASFRLFGRRLYRMAPIHHHFELGGWPETTVIVRFWILAGLGTALAIGIFYADYLSIPGAID